MNKQVIIPRVSQDETTFAVIQYAGCNRDTLATKLKAAVRGWFLTEDCKEYATETCSGDFNLGDLANLTAGNLADHLSLGPYLHASGITYLEVDVYSDDGPRIMQFDDRLI